MKLREFIALEKGNGVALATALEIAPSYLSQMAHGLRPVPPVTAVEIERLTKGAVSRKETRPDDWALIWPDLAEQFPEQASQCRALRAARACA